jgi:hypothetical protein
LSRLLLLLLGRSYLALLDNCDRSRGRWSRWEIGKERVDRSSRRERDVLYRSSSSSGISTRCDPVVCSIKLGAFGGAGGILVVV